MKSNLNLVVAYANVDYKSTWTHFIVVFYTWRKEAPSLNCFYAYLLFLRSNIIQKNVQVEKHPSRGVLRKRCSENKRSKFEGEHSRRSAISIKLQKNTSGRLLPKVSVSKKLKWGTERFAIERGFPKERRVKPALNAFTRKLWNRRTLILIFTIFYTSFFNFV